MSTFQVLRRMGRMMLPHIKTELKAVAGGTAQHLSISCGLILTTFAIYSWSSHMSPALSWMYTITAVVLLLLRGVFAYAEQLFNHDMAFTVLKDIRDQTFNAMRALAPAKTSGRGRGNLVTVLMQDIELLEIFYAHTLSPIAIAMLTGIVNIAIFSWMSPLLGLVAAATYLVIAVVIPLLSARRAEAASQSARDQQALLHSQILEFFDGQSTIRALDAQNAIGATLANSTESMSKYTALSRRAISLNGNLTETFATLCLGAFALVDLILGVQGILAPVQTIAAFAGYVASQSSLIAVSRLGASLQPTIAAARRVFAILDETPAVTENLDGAELKSFKQLGVEQVSFSYDNGLEVLHDVSLHVKHGSFIAISGPNGAGKSTLIDLLMHFRDCDRGKISINGVPVRSILTESLRNLETLASQDSTIFSTSLRDNIALARPNATDAEIMEACSNAGLEEIFSRFPQGLSQRLTNHGSELSDGEKQRITIARALLSDATLLLLDEPTSNMDALLEGEVMTALRQHSGNKTYIIVSHRPAVLAYCDEIYRLESGQLQRISSRQDN